VRCLRRCLTPCVIVSRDTSRNADSGKEVSNREMTTFPSTWIPEWCPTAKVGEFLSAVLSNFKNGEPLHRAAGKAF